MDQRGCLVRVKIDHWGQIIVTGNTNRHCLVNRIAREIWCIVDAWSLARLRLCTVTLGAVRLALYLKEPILRQIAIILDWRDGATFWLCLLRWKHAALQSARYLLTLKHPLDNSLLNNPIVCCWCRFRWRILFNWDPFFNFIIISNFFLVYTCCCTYLRRRRCWVTQEFASPARTRFLWPFQLT